MTLSRMLHFYRNRRSLNQHRLIRSGASDNGGADQFMPRILTQNFMNNEGDGSGSGGMRQNRSPNSFGMLSNSVLRSQTITRRSQNFLQNLPIGSGQNEIIRNLPSRITNIRFNDTHTIQENIEHLDILDAMSNNQNDNPTARLTPQENMRGLNPRTAAGAFDVGQYIQQQSHNAIENSASQQNNNFLAAQDF